MSDQCWDLTVKCNDVATEVATRLDLLKKNIRHYMHTQTLASDLCLIWKGFIEYDQPIKRWPRYLQRLVANIKMI